METIDEAIGSEPTNEADSRPGVARQLWRQRHVFALVFCLTFLVVIALLLVMPVTYTATGSIIVADREPLAGTSSPALDQKVGDPADMESNILLIRSPRLLRALVAQPGAAEAVMADCRGASRQVIARLHPIDCSLLYDNSETQLLWLQDRLSVGEVGRSRVIAVSYKSPVPEAAEVLVNGLINVFLDDEHSKLTGTRDEAIDWVRHRVTQVDGELRHDEQAIEDYRSQHGLVRGVSGPLAAERLTQAAQQLSAAKAAEAEAAQRVQEISGGAASPQALESRSISDLKQQLAKARGEASAAAQRYGPRNPELIAARRIEADAAVQLSTELGRIAEAARRNLDAARTRVAAAQQELTQRTEAASLAAEAETQIAAMVRELDTKRSTFADLSRRLSELETEQRIVQPTTQLVSLAELPIKPSFPQRMPFLVGGLTLAAVLATAAGLLSYPAEQSGALALSRNYLRVPILAQIPELRLRRPGKKELTATRRRDLPLGAALALLDSHGPLLEAMRILYARLTLAGFGTRRQTLLISSEVPGEGKTFVTIALARLARASGRRVLVIESTLRQPTLEEALNGPPSPGLGGFLVGGPIDVVQMAAVPGVDFLLAGDPTASSTELLSGPRLADLLEWAKHYDLILLDSPPVATSMDTALIAPHVEGALFCLRSGRPPIPNGLNSLADLQRSNSNVVGLALTFVPDQHVVLPQAPSASKTQLARAMQTGDA